MQRDNLFGTNQFARTAAWPTPPPPPPPPPWLPLVWTMGRGAALAGGPWLAPDRAAIY